MKHKMMQSLIAISLIIAFLLPINAISTAKVDIGYQVKTNVWFDSAWGGALGGTEDGDPLTALVINLDSAPFGSGIEYRVYTNSGWLDWTPSFQIAGNGEYI